MISDYMLNENALRKRKIISEMEEYIKNKDDNFKNSDDYKNKYNHYLATLAAIDNMNDEFLEDEIDIVKHKHNPYLKLKYFISEYTNYYYKLIKKEYFVISKPININIDINNLEDEIKKIENTINSLKDEERINYILNVNEYINKELK